MAFKLLNNALDFEESNFNNNIKSLIRKKLHIIRTMLIEAVFLLDLIDKNINKIYVSNRITEFQKRFRLQPVHQTYPFTKDNQRKLIMKFMDLNKLDDNGNDIYSLVYTDDDLKILEGFDSILEPNTSY